MALNPLISLQSRPVDVGSTFNSILNNIGKIDAIQQGREQAPIRNQILEQQAAQGGQNLQQSQQKAFNERQTNRLTSVAKFAQQILPSLNRDDPQEALQMALQHKARLDQEIRNNPGVQLDTTEVDQVIGLLQSGRPEDQLTANRLAEQAVQIGTQAGLLGDKNATAGQRERNQLKKELSGAIDPITGKLKNVEDMTALEKMAAIEARLIPPAAITGQERIAASEDLSTKVAQSEGQISESKEEGKLKAQKRHKPEITRLVELARQKAVEEGVALTDLNRMTAAMPGLETAVSELRELSTIATSTVLGGAFDTIVKETGFGATKGKTAKAKFIAIINNQVLPLLKQTFGSAFTEKEGEALKKTMGDPDASTAEKMAQLDAFIAQKIRDVETGERLLKAIQQQDSTSVGDLSDEDLFN